MKFLMLEDLRGTVEAILFPEPTARGPPPRGAGPLPRDRPRPRATTARSRSTRATSSDWRRSLPALPPLSHAPMCTEIPTKHRSLFVVTVAIAAVFALAGLPPARAADPEVLGDYWDEIRINDGPVGYIHTVVSRAGTPETPLLQTTATTHMEMHAARTR